MRYPGLFMLNVSTPAQCPMATSEAVLSTKLCESMQLDELIRERAVYLHESKKPLAEVACTQPARPSLFGDEPSRAS